MEWEWEWEWQGFLKPWQLSSTSDTAVTRALAVEFALHWARKDGWSPRQNWGRLSDAEFKDRSPLGGQCNDLKRLHIYYHVTSVTAPSRGLLLVHAVELHPLVCSRCFLGPVHLLVSGPRVVQILGNQGMPCFATCLFFKNKNLQKSDVPEVHC